MIDSISSSTSMYQSSMAQMRQKMFSKIDTNGDGKLDADELAAMVANGPKGGPTADDILGKIDTNGDGAISESEFNAGQDQAQGAGGPPPPPMGNVSSEEFAKQLFADSDTDGDGKLSADELKTMVENGPQGGPSAEKLMSKLDTDGDGSVSESEFTAGAPKQGAQSAGGGSGASAEKVFSSLDTNEDGYISQAEWEAATGGDSSSTKTASSASDVFNSILEKISNGTGNSSTSDSASKTSTTTAAAELLSAIQSYLQLSSQSFGKSGSESLLGSNLYA